MSEKDRSAEATPVREVICVEGTNSTGAYHVTLSCGHHCVIPPGRTSYPCEKCAEQRSAEVMTRVIATQAVDVGCWICRVLDDARKHLIFDLTMYEGMVLGIRVANGLPIPLCSHHQERWKLVEPGMTETLGQVPTPRRESVVHRDVKPGNVILVRGQVIRVDPDDGDVELSFGVCEDLPGEQVAWVPYDRIVRRRERATPTVEEDKDPLGLKDYVPFSKRPYAKALEAVAKAAEAYVNAEDQDRIDEFNAMNDALVALDALKEGT